MLRCLTLAAPLRTYYAPTFIRIRSTPMARWRPAMLRGARLNRASSFTH